jgi:PAS domain S-box-containing protein
MDSSFMGIRIVDIEGHISYSNQAFLDIFGYKNVDAATVNPPRELYTPESYVDFTNRLNKIKNGESAPDTMEVDIIRKDGAARHLQLYYKTLFWNGKQQYQTLYNDITELYQMEKKLEQAAREWRLTFDSITDLISIHDKENRFLRVNKAVADMLNTTPKELIGKYCHHVMHCAKTPPANCPHLQTMATGKPAVLECFNPTLEAHIHESTSPLFNEKGEITGSIIIARDVTLQKRIDEQLIVTERLASIGELSSGIAHELNNPLTSVIGFSQLLMEGDVPPEIKEELNTVYTEAQRAATIVKNLLTFARKHTPVKQMSQINRVVEDVLRLRTYEQKVNNIEIEKHLAENLPDIMMDHFQMQQCFLNIVVNAEFAMLEAHNEGKLIITTEQDGDIVRTSFTDNGPGISRENLKRIFDPFFTTKEVGKGTGLGLSICHGIVQEHGGKIYARSEKGQGATMIVELPLNG